MATTRKPGKPFPTRDQVLDFIRESETPVGKREIARAFGILGADRLRLKKLLREIALAGDIERGKKRRLHPKGALPAVATLVVDRIDGDGEMIAKPTVWHHDDAPPAIYLAPERKGRPALGEGDRVLARLARNPDGTYAASVIRVLGAAPQDIIGVFEIVGREGRVRSTDRRHKSEFFIDLGDAPSVPSGQLVRAEIVPGRRHGLPAARILEQLGAMDDPRTVSLVAIHAHDIPTAFPPEALRLADAAKPVTLEAPRVDLRAVPLVTIDGADARDFDDAVFAETDPDRPGGFHLIVAIADVSHYVRPGDALDKEAYKRGNSVYFPDRVVPMLPEALSNDLCSLRPDEDRACIAAHLWIDGAGDLRRHRFERGLMRSAARLTYDRVQAAMDGTPDDATGPLVAPVLTPLYAAYRALLKARRKRGTLELDLPERQITLDDAGRVADIARRPRHDSHKLIEEFMIAANVAAAETLEKTGWPCMYRVHDRPAPLKVESLALVLDDLGFHLDPNRHGRPDEFNRILAAAKGNPNEPLINDLVLRAQSQAVYAPQNIGHFGLALKRYCHFTSPIRRYADLLVHRALAGALRLGAGALSPDDGVRFPAMGEHISATERRAQMAERDATDRYLADYMRSRVGREFAGRVTGVTRFGLFVRLLDEGAEGLVPIRSLGAEHFHHDEQRHALIGSHSDRVWVLGDPVRAVLREADPVTGGLMFEIVSPPRARPAAMPRPEGNGRPGPRGRGGPRGPARPAPKRAKPKSGKKPRKPGR